MMAVPQVQEGVAGSQRVHHSLGHHGRGLKGGVGDLSHRQLLVVGLLGRDDRGVGGEHEVDAGVGHLRGRGQGGRRGRIEAVRGPA